MTAALESLSAVESAMDDTAGSTKSESLNESSEKKRGKEEVKNGGDETEEEVCDVQAWNTLSRCFKQVQAVLDQNRLLIQEVNHNQQSMIPENLTKNVSLIREINSNISKVLSIYSDLSVNFSSLVRQRKRIKDGDKLQRTNSQATDGM